MASATLILYGDTKMLSSVPSVMWRYRSVAADNVESHCRERLTDYTIPGRVEFVNELPKSSTRKIDKVSFRGAFC